MLAERAELPADPLNPEKVFHELSPRLPDGCIVTADSGSSTNWWARHLRFRRGMRGALSGTLATMGPALPYALAAKFVHPDRPVIAVEGDGAMQMNGLNALIDVAKYWRRWRDPRLIVLVLNNGDLNQVTWEQRVLSGDPKLEASQRIPDFPYARYAELLGFMGIRIDAPEQVGAGLGAGAGRRPPGGARGGHRPRGPAAARRTSSSSRRATSPRRWPRGDPARGRIVRQTLRGKLQELLDR